MLHIFFNDEIKAKLSSHNNTISLGTVLCCNRKVLQFFYVRFEVSTAVITNITVFLNVVACGLVDTKPHGVISSKTKTFIATPSSRN
jgi:hypothetical protein